MHRSIPVSAAAAMLALCAFATPLVADAESPAAISKDVAFTDYFPLSGNTEIIRRMLSPLAAALIPEALARAGTRLSEQPVDLAAEKFVIYIPARKPPQGYGVIVFVPPWNKETMPSDWVSVLDRFGLIFVSTARSGNDQSVLGRRYPLALLAEHNIAGRYRLDPQRIFIAGFSGGSRVALRLALAYPDVFRGAILNAGSDPIGGASAPLPPRDLLFRFQESTHLVYITGDRDELPTINDRASMRSLGDWCVFNVDSYAEPFVAHDTMSGAALTRALEFLAAPARTDADRIAACREGIDANLGAQLQDVESLIVANKTEEARQKLQVIDNHFGGLAAPRSLELAKQLDKK